MGFWVMILKLLLVAVASNASSFHMCHHDEREALLAFKKGFAISNVSFPESCDVVDRKTESWIDSINDCCKWDGVTCDSQTGHVVELDLSCSLLAGTFPSNTTLFLLRHLRLLSLASNSLSGEVPREIGWLSHLNTLDLSGNTQLKMSSFQTSIANLTDLRKLDLTDVSISSNLPPIIFNFSKLGYLGLSRCGLEGEFVGTSMQLAELASIDLSGNKLTGIIPGWIFTLPSLNSLSLENNAFTGIAEFEIGNGSALNRFSAQLNQLQGHIPDGIFELHNLQHLELERNNLSGTIPLSKIHNLQRMKELYLSDNSLSIIDDMGANTTTSWPSFDVVSLSSCNLGHFPAFLRGQVNLTNLVLSNNGIHDLVPNWLMDLGNLSYLNISHNSLSGGLEHLSWEFLYVIDIRYNLLQGVVPVPSPNAVHLWASNNQFTMIPSSLCAISAPEIFDLAHNNLTGNIPDCFGSLISQYLYILDLRQNQLQGVISTLLFEECPYLFTLTLSGNKLEGPIPQSITNCSQLQFIDLSRNNLNDTFPHWLGVLPNLRVLNLGSNNLHGTLMGSNTTNLFLSLQILDISDNDLIGRLPGGLLMSMKAMVNVTTNIFPEAYLGEQFYQDSIMAWVKGFTRRLDAIFDTLVLIDASRNRLEGPIPDAFGDLSALRDLNLAHNNFTGHIPPSLSNLTLLESLDLSFNRLDGGIPSDLVNLVSLELFNVSENDLVGPVPTGKQFDTFLDTSYMGNPGLCGPLLTNKCRKPNDAPPNSTRAEGSNDESSGLQVWEIGLMGCGCGILVGLAWGYLMFWMYSPCWVERLIYQIETLFTVHQWKRRQNKRR